MQGIFCVKDLRADCYLKPFIVLNVPEAIRAVSVAANNPDSNLGRFPTEYALYQCGSFEESDGSVIALPQPTHICIVDELVNRKEQSNAS